jgi:hypothetical protein
MTAKPTLTGLKTAAAKAAARAAAAKRQVRLAKVQLKQARKAFKAAKKAAKQARRQVDAAGSSRRPRPAATLKLQPAIRKASLPPKILRKPKTLRKPQVARKPQAAQPKAAVTSAASKRALKKSVARVSKARAPKVPPMRSAAEIAKTVIERLHAPPPVLPAPIIPPEAKPISDSSTPEPPQDS